jgi:hypothetical protein
MFYVYYENGFHNCGRIQMRSQPTLLLRREKIKVTSCRRSAAAGSYVTLLWEALSFPGNSALLLHQKSRQVQPL